MRQRSKKNSNGWQDPAAGDQITPVDRAETVNALRRLLSVAAQQTAQSKIVARFLLALRDSERFQFKLMDLRVLEKRLFKDCMAVLGLPHETLVANVALPESRAAESLHLRTALGHRDAIADFRSPSDEPTSQL